LLTTVLSDTAAKNYLFVQENMCEDEQLETCPPPKWLQEAKHLLGAWVEVCYLVSATRNPHQRAMERVTGLLYGVDPELGHLLLGVPLPASTSSSSSSVVLTLFTGHSIVSIAHASPPITNGNTSAPLTFTDPLTLLINSSIEDGEITFST
jgi:hypothetical protein